MEQQLTLGIGEALGDRGIALVAENNRGFVEVMREHAIRVSLQKGSVTSDDLRQIAINSGLEPHHPNAWGAIFRAKGWEAVGFVKSRLPSNHGRRVCQWRWSE